uniref:Phytanoyl-CoA dioxygenase n=1 Tax=Alexandrium catenella TaxID=2925 RepID=A0A7S1RDI8_ALECA
MTPQHRLEYFRDGFTIIEGALPAPLLRELRRTMKAELGGDNSIWSHYWAYDSDALADFYIYSPLGSIAAQVFETPGTPTAAEKPSAYLWRDFLYFRDVESTLTGVHVDIEDCDKSALPPNATLTNRPRIWVPLDDDVWVPVFTNFSKLFHSLQNDSVRERCLRGELDHMEGYFKPEVSGPWFGFKDLETCLEHLMPRRKLRLGDVALHVPCLRHQSSPEERNSTILILFPTYASASSPRRRVEGALRSCGGAHEPGATIRDDPSCFLQAWPPEARPEPGSTRAFPIAGSLVGQLNCTLRTPSGHGTNPTFCHRQGENVWPNAEIA